MTMTVEAGTMRHVAQPGPAAAERIQWVEGRGRAFSFTLQPGLSLLDAVQRGFTEAGFAGGAVRVEAGAFGPFAYVMPALSQDGRNAAFYSETFRPAGVTRLTLATMTLGRKDGAPFMHCHALWTEADGRPGGGHVLADQTVVAEPFEVEAFGFDGGVFTVAPDAETNFSLFGPVAAEPAGAQTACRAFALRLKPNQDFAAAMEGFCRQQGIGRARVHGGVGSTIGARFTDGRSVEPFATELAIRAGAVAPAADGAPRSEFDIGLVDYTGGLAEGRLKPGDNPVLMTMELVLEVC
jgi:predicted DNA-binding protein with PD1-like motif